MVSRFFRAVIANPLLFQIGGGILYLFYGLLIGVALVPAVLFVTAVSGAVLVNASAAGACVLALCLGVAFYLFLLCGVFVFGLAERLLSIGFRPGTYQTGDPLFYRWLIYSGVHTVGINLILPLLTGSEFIRLYFRLAGAKLGRNVFLNTVGLHDSYLLEIGDDVIIGGKTDLTCHIFEGGKLILGRIRIGNHTAVGANCYIMPGVTLGDNSTVGANAQIRKNRQIEPGSLLLALPALPAKQAARFLKK